MWTPSFDTDTEKPGIGTATATHDDPPFSYSRHVNTNDAKDVSAFCTEAKAILEKETAVKADRDNWIAKIFVELQK